MPLLQAVLVVAIVVAALVVARLLHQEYALSLLRSELQRLVDLCNELNESRSPPLVPNRPSSH